MTLKFDQEEINIMNNLSKLEKIKFSDQRFNKQETRGSIISDLQLCLICFVLGKSADNNEDREFVYSFIKKPNKTNEEKAISVFAKSYAVALITGYLQSLNNDRADIEEKPFAFKDLDSKFQSSLLSNMGELIPSDNVTSYIKAGFGVSIRECSGEDYFANEYYHDDLKLLRDILVADIDDGYNKKMLKAIEEDGSIGTAIDSYMSDLKAVYTLVFENAFGLNSYAGVLCNSDSFITVDMDSVNSKIITEGQATLSKLAGRMASCIGSEVEISSLRQFDYDTIFKSNHVVYFPYKILEYALGRESTLNTKRHEYRNSAYSISYESYSENYLYPNLKAILQRGIYKAFEHILLSEKKIKAEFISADFTSTMTDYTGAVVSWYKDEHISSQVDKYIAKLVNSMKCFYILTKYTYLAKRIASIFVRVSCQPDSNSFTADQNMSEKLFKGLVSENKNQSFTLPIDLASDRKSDRNVRLSVNVFDYQYDINPSLSEAEPLFGYTVQKLNQRKGKVSDWNRILIGQSISGKELYASANSDIPLQNLFIHNIYAGSRSGKGVMTMNILASALAAGKPIFYLDKKPDMASMLWDMSRGTEFVINGGAYGATYDSFNHFDDDTGDALEIYRQTGKKYLETHPEICELFGNSTNYASLVGDYCYLRAAMFCMGLNVLRCDLRDKDRELYNELFNGDDGIIVVLDELYSFQSGIGGLLAGEKEGCKFFEKAVQIESADKVLNKKADIEGKIKICQAKIAEAKKESAIIQQEIEIEKLKRELSTLIDETAVYANSVYSKIADNYKILIEKKVAGFKNHEFIFSDYFVLGQGLDIPYYSSNLEGKYGTPGSMFFPLKADKEGFYSQYKKGDFVRSFLEEFGEEDWFLGRNVGTNYAKKNSSSAVEDYLDEKGNWEYVGRAKTGEITGAESKDFSNPVLFKPYLVLNTNFENNPPTAEHENVKYDYVRQCAQRVIDTSHNPLMWESVRVKHLKPDAKATYSETNKHYNELEEGVGFNGLVYETLQTLKNSKDTEKNKDKYINRLVAEMGGIENVNIEELAARVLGRSGEIANYVAEKMGYKSWQHLIFDFSPEGIFGWKDMVNAVMHPEDYNLKTRLPVYYKLGLLGGEKDEDGDGELPDGGIGDSDLDSLQPTIQPSPTQSEPNPSDSIQPEPSIPVEPTYGNDAMNAALQGYEPQDEEPDEDDIMQGYESPDEEDDSDDIYGDYDTDSDDIELEGFGDDADEEENNVDEILSHDGSWTDSERINYASNMVNMCLQTCTMLLRSQGVNVPDLWTNQGFVNQLISTICNTMKGMGY